MEYSDIYIYESDIISEKIEGGRIEYLDSNMAREAWLQHKKHYILYQDSFYLHVYNENPKKKLHWIDYLVENYTNDSSRISELVLFDGEFNLTIQRVYTGDQWIQEKGKYFDKEVWHFGLGSEFYYCDSIQVLSNNYPWK